MILLTILAVIVTKKYLYMRRKLVKIRKFSSNDPQTGTSQTAAAVYYQANDKIFFENNLYGMH